MRQPRPARPRPRRLPRSAEPEPWRRSRARRGEHGSTSSLELMALTPMLALGVLFILWAGRSSRAELATSLAAQEAAVAAALCCNDQPPAAGSASRELMAEAVLGARPGLDHLCLGGPQPPHGRTGIVTHTQADLSGAGPAPSHVRRLAVTATHVTCETDGAIAPVRGLFGTRTLHGHGTHVAVFADPPQAGGTP